MSRRDLWEPEDENPSGYPTNVLYVVVDAATEPALVAAVERTGKLLADFGHTVQSGAPEVDAHADAIAVLHTVSNAQLYELARSLLDRPRGSTRAFFDVEFATTGWTSLANVTGWAAVSLPLGATHDGLPIGAQLMAPDETILLKLAAQLEAAVPWAGRRPPAWVGGL